MMPFSSDKNKRKVLFLINDLGLGGAQRVVYEIAERLPRELFDVQVFMLKDSSNEKHTALIDLFAKAGIQVGTVGAGLSLSVRDIWRLARLIRKERPDIIHAHLPISVIAAAFANLLAGKRARLIAHEHNTYSLSPKKILYARRLVAPLVDLTICFTRGVEQEMFRSSQQYTLSDNGRARRSWSIYNGADVEKVIATVEKTGRGNKRKELGANNEDMLVLAVARLISWKGHSYLIEAAALAREQLPSLRIFIAGSGPMEAELNALIEKLGVEDVVTMLGARSDVYELLAVADVYSGVYVYEAETATKESVGISGFEAMAARLPVIAADYPSAATFIEENETGITVTPGDSAALAEAIVRLGKDAAKRAEIGRRAQQFAIQNLSWKRIAHLYEKIYNDLAV